MRTVVITMFTFLVYLFSAQAMAGMPLNDVGPSVAKPNPDLPGHSSAFGKSLDAWVEAYLRSALEGAAIPKKKIEFLPIFGEEPTGNVFEVEVKTGTKMVLPIALYLGFPEDPPLAPSEFTGVVTVDGQLIADPNEDYYFGPTDLDPPIILGPYTIAFYQGLGVVIKSLTPGLHTIELYSSVEGDSFHNTWLITVKR